MDLRNLQMEKLDDVGVDIVYNEPDSKECELHITKHAEDLGLQGFQKSFVVNEGIELEEPMFKNIQISPIRNLKNSFEKERDGGDGFVLDFDSTSDEGQGHCDDLGLDYSMVIVDKRSLSKTITKTSQ